MALVINMFILCKSIVKMCDLVIFSSNSIKGAGE